MSRQSTVSTSNPISSNKNLAKLLQETKDLDSEEAFTGWKESFLEEYTKFLDPTGVENAEASNDRLVRSLERLAKTVVTVNDFVKDGKITSETQSVQGKRHLTNMTDILAETEKEVARFLPTTGAEETKMGYDKFELGAVMIEDGFHVYELLKTTKDIIQHLQELVLNQVLPGNKQSIIQFYLRQIQSFCDVMADLGLFGLMERMMEIYNVKPRSKNKPVKEKLARKIADQEGKPNKPERVLDPNVNYTRRSAYTNGYKDPFSGTQPGREEFEDVSDSDQEDDDADGDDGDDDENHFIIYFDMKTGTIGKIPRDVCKSSQFIVTEDEKGNEQLQGEIENEAEKQQLIWDLKKAIKAGGTGAGGTGAGGTGGATSKQGKRKSPKSSPKASPKSSPKSYPKSNPKSYPKSASSGSDTQPPSRTSKDRPPLGSKAQIEGSNGEENRPLPKNSQKARSKSVQGATQPNLEAVPKDSQKARSKSVQGAIQPNVEEERETKRTPPRKTNSESLVEMSKSPGALSARKPRISRAKSGDGMPTIKSPGVLSSKPRISRAKSGDGMPTKASGASVKPSSNGWSTLVENNKSTKAAPRPSATGWATASQLASKRRGDE